MSVEPTSPGTNDETTARIPLTPPPASGVAAAPADAESGPGESAGQSAPSAPSAAAAPAAPRPDAREKPDAFGAPTGERAAGNTAAGDRAPSRPSPRTGPIVWGALILVFCGYISQQVLGGGGLDAAGWITATIIGLGVLLLGVGFAVLIRGRRDTRRRR